MLNFQALAETRGGAAMSTPFSPPSGPATGSFNSLHRESNFLAIIEAVSGG